MNSIFKRKKSPEQLVKLLKEALFQSNVRNSGNEDTDESTDDEITKRLNQIKVMLYGEAEQECNPQKCAQLAELLISENILLHLIKQLHTLPFEARKHVAQVYNNLMRRDLGNFVAYVTRNPEMISVLMNGYEAPEVALNCGTMLRESLRHESLTRIVLESEDLWKFFDTYVHLPNFDLASDAFASFKDILSKHKALTVEFFERQFDQVFDKYNKLLESENYVTRRQSLKLLGEILLDRPHFNTMMRYIGKRENLKMMMNLLRDPSPNIQFEAFHVFKVFVANPKKPDDVTQILINNRTKLIAYLEKFQNEKEDEQFSEEKALLIRTLSNLELTSTPSTLTT